MDPTLRFQALSVKYGWVNFNANVSVSMGLPAPIKPSELVGIPRRTGAAPDENDIPANLPRFQRSLSTIRHSSSSNNEMTNSNPSETSSPPRSPSFTSPCVPPCPPQSSLRSSRRRVVLSYTESDSESPILAAASPSAGATSPPVPCTRARRTPGRRIIDSDDDNSVDNVFDAAVGSPADLPPVPVDEAGLSDDSFYSCKSAPKTRQPIAPPQDIISPDVPVPKRPESRTPATNRRRVVLTPTSSDSASSVDDSGCASRSNHELFIASEDEDNDIDCISIGSDSDVPSPPLVPLPTPSRTPSHKRPPAKNSKTPVAAVTPHTPFRGNGLAQRQQLTASAFREFNMRVFGDALPADLSVDWSARLRRTAGMTRSKRADGVKSSRIELSTKVLDTEYKLRKTLLHEMCHAAAWLIDGELRPPHGPRFWYWAKEATRKFPDLEVTRCHSYQIQFKHIYRCTTATCGMEIGRHSKSIDVEAQRCGRCGGTLLLMPKLRPDGTPAKSRAATAFSAFVKEHFGSVKASHPRASHRDIMGKLSSMWAGVKASAVKAGATPAADGEGEESDVVSVGSGGEVDEETDAVTRRMSFE